MNYDLRTIFRLSKSYDENDGNADITQKIIKKKPTKTNQTEKFKWM